MADQPWTRKDTIGMFVLMALGLIFGYLLRI